jgi:hypothetical protein
MKSFKRYVRRLRGAQTQEARAVILTAPGEDYGESGVMLRAAAAVARAHLGSLFRGAKLSITPAGEMVIPPPVQPRKGIHDVFQLVLR